MSEDSPKQNPVIIITGTPGTGKSTLAQLLLEDSPVPLQHINVGQLVKDKGFHHGFDQQWQSYTVNEDKVRTHHSPPSLLKYHPAVRRTRAIGIRWRDNP